MLSFLKATFTSNSLSRIEARSEPYRALLGGCPCGSPEVKSLCKCKKRGLLMKDGWRLRAPSHWDKVDRSLDQTPTPLVSWLSQVQIISKYCSLIYFGPEK
jgi:hypothetical protein